MPNPNWKLLGDVSMLTAIGMGVVGISRMSQTNTHQFDSYKFIVRDRALVNILAKLHTLKQTDSFDALANKINAFLELGTLYTDAGFTVNRLSNEIRQDAQSMCDCAKASNDVDILNTIVDFEDELLGSLDQICQNTLQNMLLRRM